MEEKGEPEGEIEEKTPDFVKFTICPSLPPKKIEEYYEEFEQLIDLNEDTGATVLVGNKIGESKKLAFKIIEKSKIVDDNNKIERLRREVQIYSKVKFCKHVVPLRDILETDTDITLVMDFVDGGQLFDKVTATKGRRLSEEDASRVVRQLAECIQDLHKHGVCHRDLKPENILITKEASFNIKLIDFGLAKFIEIDNGLEIIKASTSGSLPYIAPEMLEDTTTKAIDIWAIGIIMYFMLFGNTPFYDLTSEKEDEEEVCDRILEAKVKLPKNIPVSKGAKEVLSGCLKKNPSERWTCQKILEHPWTQGVIDRVVPLKVVTEEAEDTPNMKNSNEDLQKLKQSINIVIDASRDLKTK